MDRREAIRRTAMLMGSALSAPAIMGVLNGCTAKPIIDWKPVFLNENQAAIISEVAEIIIPKTDTPGAKDVGVPAFIDLMLNDVYGVQDKEHFLEGLKEFDAGAREKYGDDFGGLDSDQQVEYVREVHAAALQKRAANGDGKRPFILSVKELTLLGFFTSEPGATQVLQYDPVPGEYNGCVSLKDVGKTWAT